MHLFDHSASEVFKKGICAKKSVLNAITKDWPAVLKDMSKCTIAVCPFLCWSVERGYSQTHEKTLTVEVTQYKKKIQRSLFSMQEDTEKQGNVKRTCKANTQSS